MLAYPDYSQPFVLQTDASGEGLGAVLAQFQGGTERVIAYASRVLSPAESRQVHNLEFLALKWALIDKLYEHLYGNPSGTCRGAAMGARALVPLKDQSALLSGHLNFQCFVKLHMNN